eukprot:TRINITY_DN10526_c0_g1_i2.p1 TRINITY_DN10526_c0_g1~~TRINITY_DN10526_c0_g1_i2.p1  ORF type:complete len:298 (-),score=41.70 TRINITY_DN10526_c0_g1_i2:74-913(-)
MRRLVPARRRPRLRVVMQTLLSIGSMVVAVTGSAAAVPAVPAAAAATPATAVVAAQPQAPIAPVASLAAVPAAASPAATASVQSCPLGQQIPLHCTCGDDAFRGGCGCSCANATLSCRCLENSTYSPVMRALLCSPGHRFKLIDGSPACVQGPPSAFPHLEAPPCGLGLDASARSDCDCGAKAFAGKCGCDCKNRTLSCLCPARSSFNAQGSLSCLDGYEPATGNHACVPPWQMSLIVVTSLLFVLVTVFFLYYASLVMQTADLCGRHSKESENENDNE